MKSITKNFFPLCLLLATSLTAYFYFTPTTFPIIPNRQIKGVVKNSSKAFDGYFLKECNLYDNKGVVLDYYGYYCHFLPDGHFISHTRDTLVFYNSKQEILWKKDFFGHHDLAFSFDRKEIASLTGWESKTFIRSHGFLIHDFSGNEILSWNLEDHVQELEKIVGFDLKEDFKRVDKLDKLENWRNDPSHSYLKINSIHIIQKTELYPEYSYLKPGNILINIQSHHTIAIVDRDTKKIVWNMKAGGSGHAARLTDHGSLVFFENRSGKKLSSAWEKFLSISLYYPSAKLQPDGVLKINQQYNNYAPIYNSKIFEYSFIKNKIIWSYSYPYRFYASVMGNIQVLPNGNFLITHITHGGSAFELTREKEIVWEWVNEDWDEEKNNPAIVFQIVKVDKKWAQPALENKF